MKKLILLILIVCLLSGCSYMYCKNICGNTQMQKCDMKATGGTSDCTHARWWKLWE